MKYELIATATFGLEAVVKREIESLGFKITKSEDAKITFIGDERAIVISNLWLRSADRVLIKLAEFNAFEFEDLFQNVKGFEWERFLPPDADFTVDASSVKSKLSSVPSIQSVAEKAIISRLGSIYGIEHFEKNGAKYDIKVTVLKDRATVTLDTSGPGLHKRGYRTAGSKAPIKETLAAALVQLSFWNRERILADPFCGSGTIPIEAAMIGKNIAPGISRGFAAEHWELIPEDIWKAERAAAFSKIDDSSGLRIYGSDIDKRAIEAARENSIEAGVDDAIEFSIMPFSKFRSPGSGGIIITNPPYGERMGDKNALASIYSDLANFFDNEPSWSLFLITADKRFEEKALGRSADRRRKLYNGRIETTYYQYHGVKKIKKQ